MNVRGLRSTLPTQPRGHGKTGNKPTKSLSRGFRPILVAMWDEVPTNYEEVFRRGDRTI